MKRRYKTLFLFFILSWWAIAFQPSPTTFFSHSTTSDLEREKLLSALKGNEHQMLALLEEWDSEADNFIQQGHGNIKRIPYRFSPASTTQKKTTFLPQTYSAAHLLLALLSPQQIAALPGQFRETDQTFSKDLLAAIPYDNNRYSAEHWALHPPQAVIVGFYSDTAQRAQFERLQIPQVELKEVTSLNDLLATIDRVGQITEADERAEHLKQFCQACWTAYTNKWKVLQASKKCNGLCLYLHHHFSLPTERGIFGHLLKEWQLNCHLKTDPSKGWQIPFSREQIEEYQPDVLFVISGAFANTPLKNSSLKTLIIDRHFADATSQFFLVTLHDIYTAGAA